MCVCGHGYHAHHFLDGGTAGVGPYPSTLSKLCAYVCACVWSYIMHTHYGIAFIRTCMELSDTLTL